MLNKKFDIALHTPIGTRKGFMNIKVKDKEIEGILHILKQSVPFKGVIEPSGKCSLSGNLITLMNTIPYKASGYMNDEKIELLMNLNKGFLKMSGKVCD